MLGFLGERGWDCEEVVPVQATYRPGRACTVRFRVRASGPTGHRTFSICAETRARPRFPAAVSEGFEERFRLAEPVGTMAGYRVWAFPYDPALEDLPGAAWGPAVVEALGSVGRTPAAVGVQPLRYRPGRRAVFRYRALHRHRGGRRWETVFGKVLPEDKAVRALAVARSLKGTRSPALALPMGSSGRHGVLVPSMPGRSLRDLLLGRGSLPAPTRVAGLPEALAAMERTAGIPPLRRIPAPRAAESAARLVTQLVPGVGGEAARVAEAAAAGEARSRLPEQVVHGDLYEAQVFVGRDYSLGLIDLDDLGAGDPAMDAANFCAHLLALTLAFPGAGDRLVAYRSLVRAAFLSLLGLGPRDLAWREALAMLLLATGPFRVLDPAWPAEVRRRVALAVRLLEEV